MCSITQNTTVEAQCVVGGKIWHEPYYHRRKSFTLHASPACVRVRISIRPYSYSDKRQLQHTGHIHHNAVSATSGQLNGAININTVAHRKPRVKGTLAACRQVLVFGCNDCDFLLLFCFLLFQYLEQCCLRLYLMRA